MNKAIRKLFFFITMGFFLTPCFALIHSSDSINLFSDSVIYSRTNQTITYHGHVKLKQGSTELQGDTMTVYHQKNYHQIAKVIIHGAPAHFQFSVNKNTPITGQAKVITFEPVTKKLMLEGSVHIQQNPVIIINQSGGSH